MLSLSKHTRRPGVMLVAMALIIAAAPPASPQLPDVDYVLVEKSARRMTLYSGGRPVYRINGIQLGDRPLGPKRFAGDERTPEGRYTIDYGNPDSAYHLSLHISYPNADDVAYARAHGRSSGGLIFIHGAPNDYAYGHPPGDWTDGCIAVSNAEIELMWNAVLDGATIDIVP
jgi:murein L,D-transpeptidase YafK